MQKIHLNILAGPTGVGKTGFALQLARKWNTEIVSVDSMQVYRQLNIGTAKPTREECGNVLYHLIDCENIDKKYDLARFINDADKIINRLHDFSKIPLIVGGTGLYIKGLLQGIFENESKNDDTRIELNRRIDAEGLSALYLELEKVDPEAAERITPGDRQRIVRALEVFKLTGSTISELQKKSRKIPPRYTYTLVVLNRERSELYERIEKRVDEMFESGFVNEVKGILDAGFSEDLHPLKALGYRDVINVLKGESSLEFAIEEMKKTTRRYAKRQLTWFRGMPDARWLNISGIQDREILNLIENEFLKSKPISEKCLS
jgi:tRNA dimethylallyltransferase